MLAEVFFVRRSGGLFAEPTGGAERYVPCADPQCWWAETRPDLEVTAADERHLVQIDAANAYPDHGSIGKVMQVHGCVGKSNADQRELPSDLDAVSDCLARVPESWLPYEVRLSERPGRRWDAFVGTLLPVPSRELSAVLGEGWDELIRIEPWLRPC
jgi:hypothetical protein